MTCYGPKLTARIDRDRTKAGGDFLSLSKKIQAGLTATDALQTRLTKLSAQDLNPDDLFRLGESLGHVHKVRMALVEAQNTWASGSVALVALGSGAPLVEPAVVETVTDEEITVGLGTGEDGVISHADGSYEEPMGYAPAEEGRVEPMLDQA